MQAAIQNYAIPINGKVVLVSRREIENMNDQKTVNY